MKMKKQLEIPVCKPSDWARQQTLEMVNAALKKEGRGGTQRDQLPADERSAEHWAAMINGKLRSSVDDYVGAGKDLLAAKEKLDHGEWLRIFEENLVELDKREAQRRMQVARHRVISNGCGYFLAMSFRHFAD
jgi:hypothetical protein